MVWKGHLITNSGESCNGEIFEVDGLLLECASFARKSILLSIDPVSNRIQNETLLLPEIIS